MKLITEVPILAEAIYEGEGKDKSLYLEGILSTAENVNKNGRSYPLKYLQREFERYDEQHVKNNTATGELNHPASAQINPDRVSHRITEINREGNDFFGKALVLENDPMGDKIRSMIKAGIKIGVSTRALGTTSKNEGVDVINEDLNLVCVDVVMNPSNQSSFVNGILEGMDFIMEESGIIVPHKIEKVEEIKEDIKKAKSVGLTEAKLKAFKDFMNVITKV